MKHLHVVLAPLVAVGLFSSAVLGGTVTQKSFQSTAMSQSITYFLYRPANYATDSAAGKQFSVIYLMHWWSYKADGWSNPDNVRINPQLDKCIDSVSGIICVAPQDPTNAGYGPYGTGWWVDSPVGKLGTMLSQEMVSEADATNQTYKDRGHRGLCGASMGGFGVLHHIRTNSAIFSVGYAIVPATDLRNYQSGKSMGCSWGLCSVFSGSTWTPNNPMENINDFLSRDIYLETQSGNCDHAQGCPSSVIPDFFYNENITFDQALTTAGFAHVFHNMPATGHDYPNIQNMTNILRMFQSRFNGVSVAPGSNKAVHSAIRSGATKTHLSVQILKKTSAANGDLVGINGQALTTTPTSGIVIKTK